MTPQDYSKHLADFCALIDRALEESLPPDSTLVTMMRYTVLAPGKRIRPILALAGAELLGVSDKLVLPFALALEHIHTSSLVHDDLPALDNDSLRRGRPTAHVQFGEAEAILAGDALLARAFAVLFSENGPPEATASLMRLLADAVHELCEGQLLDLAASAAADSGTGQGMELAQLRSRHAKKTAALIVAALSGPAYFCPKEQQATVLGALADCGLNLGLLFQITDDVLDATATTAVLGKTAAADSRQGTPTYVSELGLARARELAEEHAAAAKAALQGFGERAGFLTWLIEQVRTREK